MTLTPLTFLITIIRYEFRDIVPDTQCCRIFRCAQQYVYIRQNNSLAVSHQFMLISDNFHVTEGLNFSNRGWHTHGY